MSLVVYGYNSYNLDFRVGDRVQLKPHTDLWMRGARYGTVVRLGRLLVHVEVDALHRVVTFNPLDLEMVDRDYSPQ
jgi:hypothetical protein